MSPEPTGVAFAALRHRDFPGFFAGNMLSMMADNIEHVIRYWVVFQLFHSPAVLGFAVISRGRLIGLYNMSAQGLRTFSGVSVRLLGSYIGIHWSLRLRTAAVLLVTIVLFIMANQSRESSDEGNVEVATT